jgi:NADPH:quinone reductase-like Zn-dependent oxidoreductase
MKAMQYQAYGEPSQLHLAETAQPEPSATQLVVKVAASSVNPVDWKLHSGAYRLVMPIRFPSTPGFDLAGKVSAVGANVQHFRPGDRVFAMSDRRPGHAAAEYVVLGEAAGRELPQI